MQIGRLFDEPPLLNSPMRSKPKTAVMTVGDFYSRHGELLDLKLVGPALGFDRIIEEPTINRPGLALSGFFEYFAEKRIQVIGSAEMSYLRSLPRALMRERFRQLCQKPIPCLIFARGMNIPKVLQEVANSEGISMMRTSSITMKFINSATIILEVDFSPTTVEYGSMVDIMGIGTMVRGSSGVGKSECVLGLIERGYSLVADDVTRLRAIDGKELIGTAPEVTKHHMEIRGLGIINIATIFGIGSIRDEKRLDIVVTLQDWRDQGEVDRIGLEQEFYEILGVEIPHVTIPVRPGRDLARLIEVAALDLKLKSMGHNSALAFNQRLLTRMQHGDG